MYGLLLECQDFVKFTVCFEILAFIFSAPSFAASVCECSATASAFIAIIFSDERFDSGGHSNTALLANAGYGFR